MMANLRMIPIFLCFCVLLMFAIGHDDQYTYVKATASALISKINQNIAAMRKEIYMMIGNISMTNDGGVENSSKLSLEDSVAAIWKTFDNGFKIQKYKLHQIAEKYNILERKVCETRQEDVLKTLYNYFNDSLALIQNTFSDCSTSLSFLYRYPELSTNLENKTQNLERLTSELLTKVGNVNEKLDFLVSNPTKISTTNENFLRNELEKSELLERLKQEIQNSKSVHHEIFGRLEAKSQVAESVHSKILEKLENLKNGSKLAELAQTKLRKELRIAPMSTLETVKAETLEKLEKKSQNLELKQAEAFQKLHDRIKSLELTYTKIRERLDNTHQSVKSVKTAIMDQFDSAETAILKDLRTRFPNQESVNIKTVEKSESRSQKLQLAQSKILEEMTNISLSLEAIKTEILDKLEMQSKNLKSRQSETLKIMENKTKIFDSAASENNGKTEGGRNFQNLENRNQNVESVNHEWVFQKFETLITETLQRLQNMSLILASTHAQFLEKIHRTHGETLEKIDVRSQKLESRQTGIFKEMAKKCDNLQTADSRILGTLGSGTQNMQWNTNKLLEKLKSNYQNMEFLKADFLKKIEEEFPNLKSAETAVLQRLENASDDFSSRIYEILNTKEKGRQQLKSTDNEIQEKLQNRSQMFDSVPTEITKQVGNRSKKHKMMNKEILQNLVKRTQDLELANREILEKLEKTSQNMESMQTDMLEKLENNTQNLQLFQNKILAKLEDRTQSLMSAEEKILEKIENRTETLKSTETQILENLERNRENLQLAQAKMMEMHGVKCGPPPHIPNSNVNLTETYFGAVATYSCHKEYTFSGKRISRCLETAKWEEVDGTCMRSTWANPAVPFSEPVPYPLQVGAVISVTGVPVPPAKPQIHRMEIIMDGYHSYVYMAVRFRNYNVRSQVHFNTRQFCVHDSSDISPNKFPFKVGKEFNIRITILRNHYKFDIDGKVFKRFRKRIPNLSITWLRIIKGLSLKKVQVFP